MITKFKPTDRPIYGRARNGDFIATAIEVMASVDASALYLSNVNSKGSVANGWTALPNDPETLREVAQMLEDAATALEKES